MKTPQVYFIVGLLSILLYANTITHEYVWDDQLVITLNETTKKGIEGLKNVWTSKKYIEDRPTYRPVPQTIHAIQWQLFPNTPIVGHLTTIFTYVLCILSFLLVLKHFFPELKNWLVLFIGSLFSLLPAHVEVVANIKSLDEILSALFILWSLYFSSKLGWKNLLIGLLFLALSLLSKISSITLAPLVLWLIYKTNKEVLISFLKGIPKTTPYLEFITFVTIIYVSYLKLPFDYYFLLVIVVLVFSLKIKIRYSFLTFLQLVSLVVFAHLLKIDFIVFLTISFYWFYQLEDQTVKWNNYKLHIISLFVTLVKFDSPASLVLFFVFLGLFKLLNYLLKKDKLSNLAYAIFLVLILIITIGTFITNSFTLELIPKLAYNLSIIIIFLLFYFVSKKKSLNLIRTVFFSFSLILFLVNLNFSQLLRSDLIEYEASLQVDLPEELLTAKDVFLVNRPYHNVLVATDSNSEKLATICRIQLIYLKKLFFPIHLVHQHGTQQIEIASWKDGDVYLSILIHLLLIAGIYYFYSKKNYPIFFGLVWYIMSISIYTNIIRLMPDTLAERFLFLPSFGYSVAFILALYFLINKLFKKADKTYWTMLVVLLPLFVYYSYKTIDRNRDWESNYTLSVNTLPYASKNAAINAQYAHELSNLIKYNLVQNTDSVEALLVQHFKIAANLFDGFYSPNSDLAAFFISKAEPDSAFPYLVKSAQLLPDVWTHHYYLGLIYFERSKYAEAVAEFEAVKKNEDLLKEYQKYPELLQTIEMQAQALHKIGKDEQAYIVLEDGISLYQQKSTYVLLANFYRVTGKTTQAIEVFKRLQKIVPDDPELTNTIEYLEKGLIY